ncbi:MAG: tRNA (N6-threonylcarbamoyladenosine(37)-N6)-methyltransferase TrmO [Candidatus Kariarchaeaceae archaeon]|jgi:tRNA-Thr(GGU) m(6)t(6)A37 methyltransferase TsaA
MFEIQPIGYICETETEKYIKINPEYQIGLYQLDTISHIFVLWWIHENDTTEARQAQVIIPRVRGPFVPPEKMGTFATRSPHRPNPIGMTLVKITSIIDRHIYIDSIDANEGTPVLDIKPYLPNSDRVDGEITLPPWFLHLNQSRQSEI